MTFRVIRTRQRTIEEVIVTDVSAPTKEDALALAGHITDDKAGWQYKRTLEVSELPVETKETEKRKHV